MVGGGDAGTGAAEEEKKCRNRHFLVLPPFSPPISPTPCIFLADLICLSERENQFMMTIGGPVMKAAQFLRHGKVSPANLGKMNHSHFIWTSVLTPPSPSPPPPTSLTPLPSSPLHSRSNSHSSVTVLLRLLQVAAGCRANRNAAWRRSQSSVDEPPN